MKKIIIVLFVIFILLMDMNLHQSHVQLQISDLQLQNVEALASGENSSSYGVQLQCNGGCVIICQAVCVDCSRTYRAVNGNGLCVGVKGKCVCGSSRFLKY
jgi:hypothetical protein